MRALHKGLHRAYGYSPHNVQGTIKAVYHISYHMRAPKCALMGRLQGWLNNIVKWKGEEYTS